MITVRKKHHRGGLKYDTALLKIIEEIKNTGSLNPLAFMSLAL